MMAAKPSEHNSKMNMANSDIVLTTIMNSTLDFMADRRTNSHHHTHILDDHLKEYP